MEQPTFGPPSDSSYYVSSSEFTSKDVEEFKKLSRKTTTAISECSSSSHMSAPDSPHMNLSPASYVQKYGVHTGSPAAVQKYGHRNYTSENDGSVMRQKDIGNDDQDVTDGIKSSEDSGVITGNARPLVESINGTSSEAGPDGKTDEVGDMDSDEGRYDASTADNSSEADIAATSELLNVSQKLLTELGIEGECETQDLRSETNEEANILHEVISPSKWIKKKSRAERLRPPLSPPKSDIVAPELSDAVAVKIDQIKSLENPEYLSKHRLSLPYTTSSVKPDRNSHRKSFPDVLEHKSENDDSYDTSYSIEEHLYNGMPLDNTTDEHPEPPYRDNMENDKSKPSCNDTLEKIKEVDDTYDRSEEEITR